jgi:hypothetical protein
LFIWLAAILLANQLFRAAGGTHWQIIDALTADLALKSVFYYLAWYAVFRLLLDSNAARSANALDFAFGLFVCLANFLTANSIVWLSTTAMALYVWATSAGDDKMRSAAAVILALALNGFWGPRVFESLAFYILRADAALVGTVLSAANSQITQQETIVGVSGGHSIIVYGPCSSFHNISLGLLCWVTVTKLMRSNWVRADFAIAALVCVTVIALNATRLSILALGADNFAYWHSGRGAELFNWATTLAVLAISIWGALRVPQPK